jgi:serine protease Do
MTRRFLVVTIALTATVAFFVGLVVAGTMMPAPAISAVNPVPPAARAVTRSTAAVPASAVSFADVAERLNPAVVNIDATSRATVRPRRRMLLPDGPDPFDRPQPRELESPRRGAGTGFIIDADGYILTNHHVVDGAERIMVRLGDGRQLRAEAIGADPDTDIALIKIDGGRPFGYAPLGDSDTLRVGEWVLAIGNPLAYEHTVTVGVVSFIGRKLFDSSLDRYIQTDAAINFGNSGGPLINARGEVIGINAAISSRASNIGFAVPINQARAILPQLRASGRVSRGYIGVTLRDVDPDLQRSLRLSSAVGALVQDVTPESPAARAGLRTYDLIVGVDGRPIPGNEALIRTIAAREPGSVATLQVLRDGRSMSLTLKLVERPARERRLAAADPRPVPSREGDSPLGLGVRDLDVEAVARYRLPEGLRGALVARVEPMSPAFDAAIERGHVVLEINRQRVQSAEDYRRLTAGARPGDVLTMYVYKPELDQRTLETVKIDDP